MAEYKTKCSNCNADWTIQGGLTTRRLNLICSKISEDGQELIESTDGHGVISYQCSTCNREYNIVDLIKS